jgi:hypothetical protein
VNDSFKIIQSIYEKLGQTDKEEVWLKKEIHIIKQIHKENIKKSVEELMWLSGFYASRKRLNKAMDSYFEGLNS